MCVCVRACMCRGAHPCVHTEARGGHPAGCSITETRSLTDSGTKAMPTSPRDAPVSLTITGSQAHVPMPGSSQLVHHSLASATNTAASLLIPLLSL